MRRANAEGKDNNMICFIGNTHAPAILREAAREKGLSITEKPVDADLIFYSQDTPTDALGNRNLEPIRAGIMLLSGLKKTLVLTSQVPPGFTRSLEIPIYYQAETLRIKDAMERALKPEMHIVGCRSPRALLPTAYSDYLDAFDCPLLRMTFEEAEFAKIAINMNLIYQVNTTNTLSEVAHRIGVDWKVIRKVLQHDSRIGPKAYLEPGDWRESKHLLRDYVTFTSL